MPFPLVPKLRLGTHSSKLRFAFEVRPSFCSDANQSFPQRRFPSHLPAAAIATAQLKCSSGDMTLLCSAAVRQVNGGRAGCGTQVSIGGPVARLLFFWTQALYPSDF